MGPCSCQLAQLAESSTCARFVASAKSPHTCSASSSFCCCWCWALIVVALSCWDGLWSETRLSATGMRALLADDPWACRECGSALCCSNCRFVCLLTKFFPGLQAIECKCCSCACVAFPKNEEQAADAKAALLDVYDIDNVHTKVTRGTGPFVFNAMPMPLHSALGPG